MFLLNHLQVFEDAIDFMLNRALKYIALPKRKDNCLLFILRLLRGSPKKKHFDTDTFIRILPVFQLRILPSLQLCNSRTHLMIRQVCSSSDGMGTSFDRTTGQ
jgi:hypothetical protein